MTAWTLILRSLRFHARSHLGVLLGATVGSAVLIGALVVGDSVRGSLRDQALARLGKVDFALASGDRLFRDQLADDLTKRIRDDSNNPVVIAPSLQLLGTAATADGAARANRVQVNGVDERFWQLANQPAGVGAIAEDAVVLNQPLARQLAAKVGDTVLVRVPKPSNLSRDAPLSKEEDSSVALRLRVQAVVGDAALGRFSLQANQVAPFNAFVALKPFQQKLEATGRANLLLMPVRYRTPDRLTFLIFFDGGIPSISTPMQGIEVGVEDYLRGVWQPADAQLELRDLPDGTVELRTPRVFLDPPVIEAARKAAPDARLLLTYFVNELRHGTNATPYSMVTAAEAPIVPADLRDDEILVNQWLADDLGAKAGDRLSVSYYVVSAGRRLEERTNTFTVRGVVPMSGPTGDRTLMPDFPGMTDSENCRDWDTGFPINLDAIRDKDEQYWDEFKGVPKAFVTLAAGQKMWANRFGDATAIRFPKDTAGTPHPDPLPSEGRGNTQSAANAARTPDAAAPGVSSPLGGERVRVRGSALDQIGARILAHLDPAAVGLTFQPVREQALNAVNQSLDFGQLFLGFSFFLIIAALLLMAMLFQFGIEQRATEIGTLLALGFTPRSVRRLLLLEGGALALLGGLLGAAGGIGYAQAMLWGLSTVWRDAIAAAELTYHATPLTLVVGVSASTLVAWGTIWLTLRRQARQPARALLAGGAEEIADTPWPLFLGRCWALWIAIASALAAAGIVGVAIARDNLAPPAFFGAGGLLLVAALSLVWRFLRKLAHSEAAARMTLPGLGLRNATRRRTRSMAIAAMLACGSFLVAAIGINRIESGRDATKRGAGTGGFALVGESSLPVVHDLNEPAGREFFSLDETKLAGVSVVPFRVRDGDDASCLNLNRAQKPRLLGVNPKLLAERGAFTFARLADGAVKENPWRTLARGEFYPKHDAPLAEDEVAAIGDAASIQWALGKKVGDTVDYTDERGRSFKLRIVGALANSLLQGNLVIDEAEFVKRFPGETGYRFFLVDAPASSAGEVSATLTRGLRDVGLELTPATTRLAAFNAVQNTYLSTFQVLGGLGLLLGSIGLGVVVLRNVLERRGELALLLAVGFRARAVKWLVVSEHGALLALGLLSGILAALVAVLPGLLAPGSERHYLPLIATLVAVLVSGALWTWAAAGLALRGPLLKALRNE
jgi:putative ABC transport system permease protein